MNLKVKIKTILGGEKPVKAFASVVIDDATRMISQKSAACTPFPQTPL